MLKTPELAFKCCERVLLLCGEEAFEIDPEAEFADGLRFVKCDVQSTDLLVALAAKY